MSWTNIDNNDSATSIRTRINNAFTSLFGAAEETLLWEIVTGLSRVKPVDDREVQATAAHINQVNADNVQTDSMVVVNDMRLFDLGGFSGFERDLAIDNEGFVKSVQRTLNVISTGGESEFNMNMPVAVVTVAAAHTTKLPPAFSYDSREIVIRKSSSSSHNLTISCTDTDIRMESYQGGSIETTVQGAWVRLKAFEQPGEWAAWFVIEDSGDWSGVI